MRVLNAFLGGLLAASACAGGGPAGKGGDDTKPDLDVAEPWVDPEAYYPKSQRDREARYTLYDAARNDEAPTLAIVGATVMTATGTTLPRGTVVLEGGAIRHVGTDEAIPEGAEVIDGEGLFVTPGLIDAHSHIGVYSSPSVQAHWDGNEMTAPVTAQARAAYGYWPQDPAITRARAGGVTTALVLPGSANLIGGHGATLVMRPGRTAAEVAFPGAPPTLKMACGENPKRVYGDKGGPATRMAEYAAFRAAYQKAAEYDAKWKAYRDQRRIWLAKKERAAEIADETGEDVDPESAPEPPARDLDLDTLAAVLRGEVLVQVHCYRAPEIAELVAVADEFGFAIRAFHHALEAYKVRDLLAERGIAVATWADWWGFKMEAFDGIPENAALFAAAGGRTVLHSDSDIGIQRLNQEAAKAMWAGRHAGLEISEDEALRWITANAAWTLGIDEVTGTLEAGKRADVVVWSGHPLSVYSRPRTVIQAGEIVYQQETGLVPTDFELGHSAIDSDRPSAAPAAAASPDRGASP